MDSVENSYLDLSTLPALAGLFLAGDAAILFDNRMEKPLWSNAAGAELVGAPSIASLLESGSAPASTLMRQFRDAAAQLEEDEPIVRGFRIARGTRTEFIQCTLALCELPDGDVGVLVTCADERIFKPQREHEAAQKALGALEGMAGVGAVLDAYGLPIAFTRKFAEADFPADEIEALSHAASSGQSVMRREIVDGENNAWNIAIANVRQNPARLLLIARPALQAVEPAREPVSVPEIGPEIRPETGPELPEATRDDPVTAAVDPVEAKPQSVQLDLLDAPTSVEPVAVSVDEDEGVEPLAEPTLEADEALSPDEAPATRANGPRSLLERWYLGAQSETPQTSQEEPALRSPSSETIENPGEAETVAPVSDTAEETAEVEEDFAEDGWARSAVEGMGASAAFADGGSRRGPEVVETIGDAEVAEPADTAEAAEAVEEEMDDLAAQEEPWFTPQDDEPVELPEAASGTVFSTQADGNAVASEEFTFTSSAEPVRFAWTVDDNQMFLSVSPELAQTVGPNAADVLGRRWSDIAKVFGFDRSGDIQRLLEKRDTWSGKSVLWPVQGTDLVVPVDLAALPAFSGARQFDGFRGFGIIRTADAVIDADETGLALVSGPVQPRRDTVRGSNVADTGQDISRKMWPVDRDEVKLPPERAVAPFPAAPGGGNVVDLTLRKRDRNDELSKTEAKAFQEIGRKLVEEVPLKPTENEPAAPAYAADTLQAEIEAEPQFEATPQPEPVSEKATQAMPEQGGAQASILKKLPVPVLVYRMGETLYANPEMLSVTGYASLEELSQHGGIDALFSPEEIDAGEGALAEGEKGTVSLRRRDGTHVNVNPMLQSVAWEGGRALLLSFRTPGPAGGEKAAIDMARVSELQNILDTATDGILVTTREGQIESLNGPAEALFGVDLREVAGKQLSELFAKESHRAVEEYMRELKEPGVAGLINNGREVIGLHAKGGLIPLFITLGKMGREEKFCAVLRDITPWKKAEEELVGARRAAESASEQKSEFLARVSHEIRTPLNAIIGFSDVMIEERFGPIDNDRYRGYLRDINRSGVHVLDLINDLLDISKIEAGKMELTYEAVDLNQLVSETVALLQPQANAERIIIRTSLSRAVPRVVADARSIRQIILNLVSNAIKFTPANGQVIVSTVYEGNGEVVMRVRDTGRGMSEREIEHAMKPFHQVNVTDERRGQGTGLGLPLTKALVEANRAYFDLESTPGEGTIAHVHFPIQRVLAD